MSEQRNPHGRRGLYLSQRPAAGWRMAMLAGTAIVLICGESLADDRLTVGVTPEVQVAQTKDDEKTDDAILLAPIAIDAKADVITGGVQLNTEDLGRINPQSMRDVFRQEPGVTVSSPIGISQQIHVNGVEDTNLAVDLDGARQANKTYHHIGTTVMDPTMLHSVKVETGVAPADAGPGALGGTISMETKDGRHFVAPGDVFGGFGKLTYNENTDGHKEQLTVAGRAGNADIMAYGSIEDGHAYKDGDGLDVQGSDPGANSLLFKLGYTADNGYRLKATANHFDDIGQRPARPDFSLGRGLAAPTEYRRQNYTLSFGDETPTAMWNPKATLAYTNTRLDLINTSSTGAALFTRTLYADIQTLNGKASNTFSTDYGKITTGLDFFRDVGKGGRDGYRATETALNGGVFVQARSSWTDDFRTSVGARYDLSRLEGHADAIQTDNGASANLNVEYDLLEPVMVYAGAGTAYGALPLGEVALFNSDNSYSGPNGGVEAAQSDNFKVGIVFDAAGFTIDGHAYSTVIRNAPLLNDSDRFNYARIDSRGFNVTAKYTFGYSFVRAGFSANNLRVNGSYLENRSADYQGTDTGESFTLEVFHEMPEYGLTMGTTNEAMLPDETQLGATGSGLDGYFVSNVHVEWAPEHVPGLSLRADVKNLFDHTYADRSNVSIVEASTFFGTAQPFNEPGRTFLVSAKLDF